MARKKILSVALAAMLTFSSVWDGSPALYQSVFAKAQTATQTEEETEETEVIAEASEVASGDYGLCDNTKDGAILHAFCWSFNTIKENMKDIAEAGYTTVQTSPANACNDSHPQMKLWSDNEGTGGCWWWHYQPTDWTIGNYQLGTKEDYAAMCEEADKYGVKIITDVIPNHTTPDMQRVSQNLRNAAGGKLYHDNGFKGIENSGEWSWGNRLACTTGMMGGLPDVNTENQGFQEYYLKYCNDLIDIGCDGFRYDTAKHIGVPSDPKDPSNTRGVNDFWDVATGKKAVNGVQLKNADNVFIYGEVLQGDNVPTQEYANYMFQTASSYGGTIRDAVRSNDFSVGRISDWKHSNPDRIVSWVESHDTYCNDHESGWMSDWQIRASWAVITARKQGAPLFMSRPDGSNGSGGNYWGNNVLGAKGNDQFKHPEVVACNHFRNAMVGEEEYLSNPNGSGSLLVIERGNRGAVIVNLGSSVSNVKLPHVADGTYTEEVSGTQVQVSGGTLNYTVPGGTVAVVYDTNVTKDPSVSVSKDSGTFTEPFDLTLTPSNATKATYSINGGDAKEFTSKTTVKIGEDAEVGDKITVTVTAEGEGTPFSKTYTYTMADAPSIPDAKIYIRVKKSDVSGKPNLYVYTEGDSAKTLNGEWPGKAMTEDGDYYVYYTNEADSALVIFSYGTDGSNQDPASQQAGYKATGYMEYGGSGKGLTAFTPSTPKPAKTATPAPTDTPKPEDTPEPSPTATAQVVTTATPEPTSNAWVSVSKENGSSFTTETMDVKITLNGAEEGTYSVDGGPEKSFKSGDAATLGQGKIADTDVTLKVTAKINGATRSNTFTYKKVFDGNTAEVKASAVKKIENLFEVVADAASADAAAETKGFYATNPNGVGKEATITIDGSFSDWSEDMLIAQGAAWDIANNFKGGHENCVLDDYALYAAWDDENLYIGWQMVNTTDTWANQGDGPLSDGGRVLDVPLMLALNVGNRPAMTGKMANGKLIWDALDISFETRVDNILLMSGKVGLGTPGFFIASDDNGGASYDPEYCLSFKTEGISYKMAEGCLPSKIMMLEGATDVSDVYDTSKYVDAKTKGHDTTYDSFYEINIPLKTLGIDKSYIEQHGIGVMQIATRGTSGIDCLPRDPSMLDNATGECAVDPSTSHEKDDADIITVPLAAVGNANGNGGEGGGPVSTVAPEKTTAPTPTTAVEKTTAPTPTTTVADATPSPTPVTDDATPIPTDVPDATTVPTLDPEKYTVNFGADRSSPQLSSTELTLKAVAYGGAGGYEYTFYVDDQIVKDTSKEAACTWKGTAGSHTIKVVVADSAGKKISSEKKYVIEQDPDHTPTAAPTATTDVNLGKATPTPNVPTETPKKTEEPYHTIAPEKTAEPIVDKDPLKITLAAKYASPRKAGTSIPLTISAQGGQAPYTYEIKVANSAGKTLVLLSSKTKNTVKWTPSKAGTYKITGKVTDADGKAVSTSGKYTISSPLVVKTFKLSKTTIKKGKTITVTAKATSIDTVKYQFRLQKIGSKKITTLRKYAKTTTYKWKSTKKGKYYIYLDVKDADGHKKTTKKKVTVK